MIPKKFLVGGVATSGSVATVAVVADQLGRSSEGIKPPGENLEQLRIQKIKNGRKEVTDWLEKNKPEGKNWQIRIEEGRDKTKELAEIDPEGLSEYLTSKTELFTSISSGTEETTFTFRKNESGNWENVFTKEQVDAWINKTLGNESTLELTDEGKTTKLEDVKTDLNQFFESLESKKDLLTSLKDKSGKKVLFEKYWNVWRHTKTEIKKWGDDNNFEIKIMKNNDPIDISEADEGDLVGLMNHFYSPETQEKLNKFKKPSKEKVTWIFKKETDDWKSIYKQETISSWIDNISDKKAKLKLYEDGTEKNLSDISDAAELEQLFNALTEQDNPFKLSSKNLITVFEKYKKSYENDKSWTQIKLSIMNLITTFWGKITHINQLEVQINNEDKKLIEVKDDELIGLLKYIEGKKEEYKTWLQSNSNGKIVFKKKIDNQWEEIKTTWNK